MTESSAPGPTRGISGGIALISDPTVVHVVDGSSISSPPIFNEGKPEGMSPISGISIWKKYATNVATSRATKVLGTALVILGNRYIMAIVNPPNPIAIQFNAERGSLI